LHQVALTNHFILRMHGHTNIKRLATYVYPTIVAGSHEYFAVDTQDCIKYLSLLSSMLLSNIYKYRVSHHNAFSVNLYQWQQCKLYYQFQ